MSQCARCGEPLHEGENGVCCNDQTACLDREFAKRPKGPCARCGHAPEFQCMSKHWGANGVIACRDRQIAAQSALLRSVTGKLEEAAEIMQFFDEYEPGGGITVRESGRVKALIDSVLEILA